MKIQEIILDILGLLLIAASIFFFYKEMLTFGQGTVIGLSGLALFVFKGSKIRELVELLIKALIEILKKR